MQDGRAERIKEGGVQGYRGIGGGVQGEGWGDAVVQDGRGAGVQDWGMQGCRMEGWRCAG